MSRYHDDSTVASDPGGVSLCPKKLSVFRKKLNVVDMIRAYFRYPNRLLDEHLRLGDSRAAVVLEVEPRLIVSAYTDELDCVVNLEFPVQFAREYKLIKGSRLLTVNTYSTSAAMARDLVNGENSFNRYSNFYPIIAEFLSKDLSQIEKRKQHISEDEWGLTETMGKKAFASNILPRNGSPYKSFMA
jgi:hypothetical protein